MCVIVKKYGLDESFHLSLGAPWLFNQEFFESIKSKIYNIHGTGLPRFRGAASFSWQILSGSRIGSCTMHEIDAGIDTGDIVYDELFVYPKSCITPSDFMDFYHEKVFRTFSKIIIDILNSSFDFIPKAQSNYVSSSWPRLITDKNGAINWDYNIDELSRFIRAFDSPYPGAFSQLNQKLIRFKDVDFDRSLAGFHSFQFGQIYNIHSDIVFVAVNGGTLLLSKRQIESQGVIIRLGDRFSTSVDLLNVSKQRFRV